MLLFGGIRTGLKYQSAQPSHR